MSQKAWMNAYTKGSKSLQDRLARVHANNPEFQQFIKQHGLGGNLSVKQSGQQKKSSVATVKPTTDAHPERSNLDREAMIKAAAEKIRRRRQAHANRVAFGGELGGEFSIPGSSFRRYSESLEESKIEDAIRAHPGVSYYGGKSDDHFVELHKGYEMDGQRSFGNPSAAEAKKMLKHIKKVQATDESVDEDIAYKDGTIRMYRGGWIALRDGKRLGTTMPTDQDAKDILDDTRKSLGKKAMEVLKRKRGELARKFGLSTPQRKRNIRSWDSAVLPEAQDPEVLKLRAAGKHEEARKLERAALSKAFAKEKQEKKNV